MTIDGVMSFKETWIEQCDGCSKFFDYDDIVIDMKEKRNNYTRNGKIVGTYLHEKHDDDDSLFCLACLSIDDQR